MRKLILFFGLFFLIVVSCQQRTKPADTTDAESLEIDTTPKATAVCWIDKAYSDQNKLPVVRTAKAHVNVKALGKIELKSFVKQQPDYVQRYIRYRLTTFRVPKVMLDSGYVKPGEQYLQLRYFPDLAAEYANR
ncbi:DUF4891 domain-containing protein [Bacteroides sp.]